MILGEKGRTGRPVNGYRTGRGRYQFEIVASSSDTDVAHLPIKHPVTHGQGMLLGELAYSCPRALRSCRRHKQRSELACR
jgi:hypothetical protein